MVTVPYPFPLQKERSWNDDAGLGYTAAGAD
jgi:hypothetical protein